MKISMLSSELVIRQDEVILHVSAKCSHQTHQGVMLFREWESPFRLVFLTLLLRRNLFARLSSDCSLVDLQRRCFLCGFSFLFLLLIFGNVDGSEIVTLP